MIKKVVRYYKKWGFINVVNNILYQLTTAEQHKCFGEKNAEETVYIIRSIDEKSCFYTGPVHNLLANFFYVMSHLKYANEKHWIPVVDQLNYPVYNNEPKEINGTMNPWEYFWRQPSGLTLDEAYSSKNVVLSKRSWFMQWNMGYDVQGYYDKHKINMFHDLIEQVPLNEETKRHIEIIRNEEFPLEGKVLGVAVRYGGYSTQCYHHGAGHPIQPEVNELIKIVEKRYREWNMDYIFLTSDEENSIENFRKVFGKKLFVLPRKRCVEGCIYNVNNPNPMYMVNNLYQTSLDYLTEMELLSQCSALIGSVTSGLRYAIIRNNMQYEHCEIIENGYFPNK